MPKDALGDKPSTRKGLLTRRLVANGLLDIQTTAEEVVAAVVFDIAHGCGQQCIPSCIGTLLFKACEFIVVRNLLQCYTARLR